MDQGQLAWELLARGEGIDEKTRLPPLKSADPGQRPTARGSASGQRGVEEEEEEEEEEQQQRQHLAGFQTHKGR